MLLAFFSTWRVALISLIVIPLSLVMAGLVLSMRGSTMNLLVLAGLLIAVALIVDDMILDVENIMRRLRQHRQSGSTEPAARVILGAVLEMRSAMIFATLIMLLALLPLFLMVGVSGAFFQPLALSFLLALLASMAVALTVTPALCLLLLRNVPPERRESPLLRWLQQGFARLLGFLTRTLRPAFLGIGVLATSTLALAALALLPSLTGMSVLPSFKEPNVTVHWQAPPGTSYPEMARITTLAARELHSIPGVRNVAANVGRAVLGDQVVDVNSTQFAISLDSHADYEATVAAIRKVASAYPGIRSEVQTYLKEITSQALTGSNSDIVVRIYGPDLNTLRSKAEEVRDAISHINGAVDVHTELQVEQPQVNIRVDLAKAKQYGLKPGDVRRAAATLVAGLEAGSLFEDQKVFQVVVQGAPQIRYSLDSIRNLLIDTPNGGHVRLGEVADVSIAPTPNLIQHETVSRRIDVGLNVSGRDPGAVASDIQQRLAAIKFPLEFRAAILGEYQGRQAAWQNLLLFGLVAALGAFLLLQAAFRSWRLATLAFFTLPTALVGGLLVAFLAGRSISLASFAGLLAVFGIAVRNCIMLIRHYQYLERDEGEPFGPDMVVRGTREKFAPILMTALAVILVLLPLVITGDIAGQEIVRPMSLVILCGLVTATLLNLFIVPLLYLRFGAPSQARASTQIPQVQYESIGGVDPEAYALRRNLDVE
jgi:Cu/Ag efflux pump CusA